MAIAGSALGVLVLYELFRPLREPVESKRRRNARNLAVAALSAASLQASERPVTKYLTRQVETRRLGLLKQVSLSRPIETLCGLLLLDYTLYIWHVLTHKVPFLWRFHKVHHADLDLDASTALRFHFGEMLISVLFRAAQVRLFGINSFTLSLWNAALMAEIIFHHSNAKLPSALERLLAWIIVTPRLHGIHHSVLPDEMNSNWSSGLTIWDRLHRTFRFDIPQQAITIGTLDLRNPRDVTIGKMLALPFT